jgi:hypothetical protein
MKPPVQIAPREDRIVGQHQERRAGLFQRFNELDSARKRLVLMNEHPIHISEPGLYAMILH